MKQETKDLIVFEFFVLLLAGVLIVYRELGPPIDFSAVEPAAKSLLVALLVLAAAIAVWKIISGRGTRKKLAARTQRLEAEVEAEIERCRQGRPSAPLASRAPWKPEPKRDFRLSRFRTLAVLNAIGLEALDFFIFDFGSPAPPGGLAISILMLWFFADAIESFYDDDVSDAES